MSLVRSFVWFLVMYYCIFIEFFSGFFFIVVPSTVMEEDAVDDGAITEIDEVKAKDKTKFHLSLKTLKNEHGNYPVWMNQRKIKQLKRCAKQKGKSSGKLSTQSRSRSTISKKKKGKSRWSEDIFLAMPIIWFLCHRWNGMLPWDLAEKWSFIWLVQAEIKSINQSINRRLERCFLFFSKVLPTRWCFLNIITPYGV